MTMLRKIINSVLPRPALQPPRTTPRPFNQPRFDYFLIWGNAIEHSDAIIEMIRQNENFQVLHIEQHSTFNIARFVRKVYSCDTVPVEHLQAKTQYLLKTPNASVVIFVRNKSPREAIVGEGEFAHVQCQNVVAMKQAIRDRFNPRVNDKRTEEHVVHASDYPSQVDHILRLIGYEEGLAALTERSNLVLDAPPHLANFERFRLRFVDADRIVCSILEGDPADFTHRQVRISDTPHYRYLTGERAAYESYWRTFGQTLLTNDHTPESFDALARDFKYLAPPHENNYILLRDLYDGRFLIQDGVHRACLLQLQGNTRWLAAITT